MDFEINSLRVFQELCLLSPEDPCQQWTIISYGLHGIHQGMRSTKINEMEENALKKALREIWEDIPLRADLHFISPSPDVGPCVHVLVEFIEDTVQIPEGIPVLRRIFRDDQLTSEAAYHLEAARASDLYHQANLQDICEQHGCQIWLNHVWLRETLPFRLRHGALLDIRVDSRPRGHINADVDEQSLLQTRSTTKPARQPIYLASHLPPISVVSCDFHRVLDANQILVSLPWLLMDLSELAMPDTALHALATTLPVWRGEIPVSYHIYTDGSFSKKTPDHGGCGIILCVRTEGGPLCAGSMSRTCLPTAKSHSAESVAMLWATLVAIQISDHHQQAFPGIPFHLEFGFDADVTGQQAAGHWTSYKHPDLQRMSRDFIYVLQHRHGCNALQWTHIKAHQGHFWNEMADLLAKHAVNHPGMVQSSDLLYSFLECPDLLQSFDWVWAMGPMSERQPHLPHLFGDHIYHFRQVAEEATPFPCHFGIAHQPTPPDAKCTVTMTLKIATYNVLTLDTKRDKTVGAGSTGRHLALLQQCHEKQIHIIGVQETRAVRVTNKNNPWYHIVSAPCRKDGHYGVQIWLHRSLAFCADGRAFQEEDYRIIHASPNALAIKVMHPTLHCIVISARAPTSDKDAAELRAFWNSLTDVVMNKFARWKVILLCDANAHVGSCLSTSISDHGQEAETVASEIFHDWLLQQGLWLPSTWNTIHKGDTYTYVTTTGQHFHRLDYVGLSHNWPIDSIITEVDYEFDGSLARCDHLPLTCTFTTTITPPLRMNPARRQPAPFDRQGCTSMIRAHPELLDGLPKIAWKVDVHKHATGIATATSGQLQKVMPKTTKQARKRHLNELTWNVLLWKRRLRQYYLEASRRYRLGSLRTILRTWLGFCRSARHASAWTLPPSDKWLKLMDFKLAILSYHLDRVQPLLQDMIRRDDSLYYQSLAERAGRISTEEGFQGLWKELRGVLPKWKARRVAQRYDIDDELCQHFAKLEAGTQRTFADLYRECVEHQNQVIRTSLLTQQIHLADLPTLHEVECLCRKTTPGRAPGPDTIIPEICKIGAASVSGHLHNLILKICCEQAEPIWYKGGLIHPIHKGRGSFEDPAAYRGVVLLDVYGKKFHAWVRGRLLPILQHRKSKGQLGGLPSEQTVTRSHILRAHGQVARSLKLSSAVIFVDVRAAFHHMLRELIFLQGRPGIDVRHFLEAEHFDVDALQRLLEARCRDDPKDFPTSLRQLTNDVHRHTWFVQRGTSFDHDRITATLRGTRPGSPVADIGFNLLMSDILLELEDRLIADEVISGAGSDFPVQLPPVTWVDDLAVPVATSSPGDLETVIKAVLQHIHDTFYSRGLQINYDKGKTEVVVMHRGADADQCRRRFFTIDAETYITTSTSSHVFRVRAVPSYKHLGIRFQMDADLEHELSCRSAMARTAFHEIRRQIFRNQSLSTSTRITLLHSLVFSKLFYGCGSWYEIPRRVAARLDGLMIRFYIDQWSTRAFGMILMQQMKIYGPNTPYRRFECI